MMGVLILLVTAIVVCVGNRTQRVVRLDINLREILGGSH